MTKTKPIPAVLYTGAATCDLVPEWEEFGDDQLAGLFRAVWAHPLDQTPLLVAADRLEEIGQSARAQWVRVACELDRLAAGLRPGRKEWGYSECRTELESVGVGGDSRAWHAVGLWSVLVGCYAPAGDGSGRRMHATWADARVRAVNRWSWLWSCWLAKTRQAYAAGHQAYAAVRQAYAVWHQADAAGHQAYAAGHQADAAGRQAYAAGHQADAAGHQAYAAGHQADAAGHQADAAGRQADNLVWRYARRLWPVVWSACEALEVPPS